MEESVLYDKIAYSTVCKWRDEIEKEEDCLLKKDKEKARNVLSEKLSAEVMRDVDRYGNAIDNYLCYIYYNVIIKTMNLGIKIGMQLQKAFTEMEEG